MAQTTDKRVLTGRERRRTDLYGRARRLLYGLMLLGAHVTQAMAGTTAKDYDFRNTASTPAIPYQGPQDGSASSWVILDSHIPQNLQPGLFGESADWYGYMGETERAVLFELSRFRWDKLPVTDGGIAKIRHGLGLDLHMPGFGKVFFDLYSPDKDKGHPGVRMQLGGEDEAAVPDLAASNNRLWSLGGSVDLVRDADGNKQLVVNPQLKINLKPTTQSETLKATVVYGYWRSATENVTANERVLQAEIRWNFGG